MGWLQIRLDTDAAGEALAETALREAGAQAVTLTDQGGNPAYEPEPGAAPDWRRLQLTALFPPETDLQRVRALVAAVLGDAAAAGLTPEPLEDRDWRRAWMADWRPMLFGRLCVCPRDMQPPPQAQVVLRLDPGLAFGTGTHPTTALCLEWLQGLDLEGRTLVDYGCGSGILGIAAAKLGAERVHGVDNDPQALTATRDNAALNGCADRLQTAAVLDPDVRADVIVANILAGTLVELAPRLESCLRPGGQLALAGILSHQAASVRAAFGTGLAVSPAREDWVLLTGIGAPAGDRR